MKRQLLIDVECDETTCGESCPCFQFQHRWDMDYEHCGAFNEKLRFWESPIKRLPQCLSAEAAARQLREQVRAEVILEMAEMGVDFSKVRP